MGRHHGDRRKVANGLDEGSRAITKVRVLCCSGAIAQGWKTTSFLVDQDILIDAGTGVGDLTREEMLRIEGLFLTHTHPDHVTYPPSMVNTVASYKAWWSKMPSASAKADSPACHAAAPTALPIQELSHIAPGRRYPIYIAHYQAIGNRSHLARTDSAWRRLRHLLALYA